MRLVSGRILIAAGWILLLPAAAQAHGTFAGAGNFYGGFLHPLLVPAEALSIVAAGLIMGSSGLQHCRIGLLATALGLILGLTSMQLHPMGRDVTIILLTATLVAAAIVAGGLRPQVPVVAAIVFSIGLGVGLDAAPESGSLQAMLAASAGAFVAGYMLTAVVAALTVDREIFWQRIAIRIAASWIAASAMLYLAWLVSRMR